MHTLRHFKPKASGRGFHCCPRSTVQVTMRAPLSQSTSIRDFWGRRWNLIIHGLMKRCFFMPFQNAGPGRARERRDRQQRMALALFTVGVCLGGGLSFSQTL